MDAAQVVRRARQAAGLSLRQLADRAGTSHATISAYEQGFKTPTVATLDRIVRSAGFALDASLRTRVRTVDGLTRGDELRAVLEVAGQFPARHSNRLEYPVFGPS